MADWVDVTAPEYWEFVLTVFGDLGEPDPDPLVWDGTQWVWPDSILNKGFKWVHADTINVSGLRLTYTMTHPYDPPSALVFLADGDPYSDRRFAWNSLPIPYSAVDLTVDDTYSFEGFALQVMYSAGLITKIEILTDWSPGPAGCSLFWTNHTGQYEVCV